MNSSPDTPYISTVRAAEALGVSVSTIKRWVDDGVLPAHKTAGGHRKLLRAEVLVLARQGTLPHQDLTSLSVPGFGDQHQEPSGVAKALLAALLEGNGKEVRSLIRRAYHSGMEIETLTDQVIAPAMAELGHDCETQRIDVWQEHRGTQLCAAAIYELKDEVESRAEQNRPVALGCAPSGDFYVLATLLAQIVLLDAGWDATNLGPNTPLSSLTNAMRALKPRLVWLSVSYLRDADEFLKTYKQFYSAAQQLNVAVAVGGQALAEPIRAAMPYTTYGDALNHLAAFARTLHPRPQRPTRGRPPKKS